MANKEKTLVIKVDSTSVAEARKRIDALNGVIENSGKKAAVAAQSFDAATAKVEAFGHAVKGTNTNVGAASQTITNTTTNITNHRRATERATKSAKGFSNNMGAVGMQMQDVIVQLQMGTSAFIVLAQQGSQLAGQMGAPMVGAAIALGAVVGGVLWSQFNKGTDGLKTYREELEKLTKDYELLTKAQYLQSVEQRRARERELEKEIKQGERNLAYAKKTAGDREELLKKRAEAEKAVQAIIEKGRENAKKGQATDIAELNAAKAVTAAIDKKINGYDKAVIALQLLKQEQKDLVAWDKEMQKALTENADGLTKKQRDEQQKRDKTFESMRDGLERQRITLEEGQAAVRDYDILMADIPETQKAALREINRHVIALENEARAQKEAASAAKEHAREQEQLNKQRARNYDKLSKDLMTERQLINTEYQDRIKMIEEATTAELFILAQHGESVTDLMIAARKKRDEELAKLDEVKAAKEEKYRADEISYAQTAANTIMGFIEQTKSNKLSAIEAEARGAEDLTEEEIELREAAARAAFDAQKDWTVGAIVMEGLFGTIKALAQQNYVQAASIAGASSLAAYKAASMQYGGLGISNSVDTNRKDESSNNQQQNTTTITENNTFTANGLSRQQFREVFDEQLERGSMQITGDSDQGRALGL